MELERSTVPVHSEAPLCWAALQDCRAREPHLKAAAVGGRVSPSQAPVSQRAHQLIYLLHLAAVIAATREVNSWMFSLIQPDVPHAATRVTMCVRAPLTQTRDGLNGHLATFSRIPEPAFRSISTAPASPGL